jgi:hypothetical protein
MEEIRQQLQCRPRTMTDASWESYTEQTEEGPTGFAVSHRRVGFLAVSVPAIGTPSMSRLITRSWQGLILSYLKDVFYFNVSSHFW